jgi:hypothetical protein
MAINFGIIGSLQIGPFDTIEYLLYPNDFLYSNIYVVGCKYSCIKAAIFSFSG